MPAPGDLAPLLRRLQAARTPLQKMKVAARAWQTLRALPRRDRLQLARQIGIESAEAALERLADGTLDGHVTSRELLVLLEEAERADPARAKELLAAVRDPRRQQELLRKAAAAVDEQVFGPSPPAFPGGVAVSPPAPEAGAVGPPRHVPAPPRSASGLPAPPEPLSILEAPALAPTVAARAAIPVPSPAVTPWAAPFAASPGPAPVAALPAQTLAFLDRLRDASTVRRLRLVREGVEAIRHMSPEELRAVLEAFPVGWTRRRALAAMLRAGVPAETSEAMALIEDLDSPTARLWCYAALLERSHLSEAERGAIRARTPIGRRSARHPAAADGTGS